MELSEKMSFYLKPFFLTRVLSCFIGLMVCPVLAVGDNHNTENGNEKALELSIALDHKSNQVVGSFNGFLFEVDILDDQTRFDVSQANRVKPAAAHENLLLIYSPKIQGEIPKEFLKKFSYFKNFKFTTITLSDGNDGNHGLLKFDLRDGDGKVRESEWYDPESGFIEKTAYYDENGQLLSYKFYKGLEINPSQINQVTFKKPLIGPSRGKGVNLKGSTLDQIEETSLEIFEKNTLINVSQK